MELAFFTHGFQHNLKMRLATKIQEEEASTQEFRRAENQTSSHKYETHSDLSSGATEIPEHFALAAQATNDAVRVWTVGTGALSWPQGFEALLGYDRSAATNEIGFWQKQIHPQDRARAAASIRDALAGEGQHWTGEYRFRHRDGSYLDVLERALIVRDARGAAVRWVGSFMDVTARKQLQDQLVRSQKMEAFGQLAGGVAHDFNNFLTTILGYSDLLLNELGMKGAIAGHIGEIRNAAGRASVLTAQLLAFSRKHPLAPCVLDVNSLITNLERSLLRLLGEDISVECHFQRSKDGTHTKVDPGQLTQILLNLVVNAREAMPHGGRLTLETTTVAIEPSEDIELGSEGVLPGDYVCISVADTGRGMSDEVKQHLFEPFFTTKDEGRGSGLGLATSYGIVRQSGGHICVESEVGNGTTVKIFLPKVTAPPPPSYKRANGGELPTGCETILVLEDDIGVRHLSVRVLRGLGYDVLEAANGDDAQRLVGRSDNKKIDLLLTDMVMPQMSGRSFADWLGKTSPETKVVFISGYLEESLHPGDRRGQEEMFFLAKPFDPAQLAKKIREALDSSKL
ncbi:MAG: two-component system, cell cycle sensor histidine kinase and response regulator CckA [Verrucomicrobiota bacterium]|jgi:PAS domain S-box-containing protein